MGAGRKFLKRWGLWKKEGAGKFSLKGGPEQNGGGFQKKGGGAGHPTGTMICNCDDTILTHAIVRIQSNNYSCDEQYNTGNCNDTI